MDDMENYLCNLSEHPEARFWRMEFSRLSLPERVFAAIWELESEVNNGGFHQFYFNSTGDIANFTPDALKAIGAINAMKLVLEANGLFPNGHPAEDQMARRAQLEAIGKNDGKDLFDQLDDKFYSYPDNLTELLYDYVILHRAEIEGA
jgi:hypothetical protein